MTGVYVDTSALGRLLREGGQVNGIVTYDQQLSAGCMHHGLSVHAPVAE